MPSPGPALLAELDQLRVRLTEVEELEFRSACSPAPASPTRSPEIDDHWKTCSADRLGAAA
jgi:hypothetical protein